MKKLTFSGAIQGLSLIRQKKWQCNIFNFPSFLSTLLYIDVLECLPTQPHIQDTKEKLNLQMKQAGVVWCFFFFFGPVSCEALLKRQVSHFGSYKELRAAPGKRCLKLLLTEVQRGRSFLIQLFHEGVSFHTYSRNNAITRHKVEKRGNRHFLQNLTL